MGLIVELQARPGGAGRPRKGRRAAPRSHRRVGAPAFSHLLRCTAQIDALDVHRQFTRDPLHRLTVNGHEARAKRLVPLRHDLQRVDQRIGVQRAFKTQRQGDVVRRRPGVELLHQPHAALRKRRGQRHVGTRFNAFDRHHVSGWLDAAVQFGAQARGQALQTGLFEDRANRQHDTPVAPHARDHLGGQQRMAAEFKEIVAAADARQAQHFGPDARQRGLDLAHRRLEGLAGKGTRIRCGQAPCDPPCHSA